MNGQTAKTGRPAKDDAAETWSRGELRTMDKEFREAMERAIRRGAERASER